MNLRFLVRTFLTAALFVVTVSAQQKNTSAVSLNDGIFTDTLGVDFDPYLRELHRRIERQWLAVAPRDVNGSRTVVVELFIHTDGKVSGMTATEPSGNVKVDRAAWDAITSAEPFPPLPREFRGKQLGWRLKFFFNNPH